MIKSYRNYRNLHNQQIVMYEGAGQFDIPTVPAYHGDLPDKWMGFNYALQCMDPENTGVHFFLDDYQFERIWNYPLKYIDVLKRFKVVIQPDFSMYRDFPKALNVFNCFRNCWLANFWTDNGVKVIPKPGYCDYESFSWGLAVHEPGGIVCASSVGMMFNQDDYVHFIDGYHEMLRVIQPELVLMYGEIPPDIDRSNVLGIGSFQKDRLHKLDGREEKKHGKQRRF